MEVEFKRYDKYLVLKLDDIEKYLTPYFKEQLKYIILAIHQGRVLHGKVPCNDYIVINEDEPYAEKVWQLIKEQWEKENGLKATSKGV